jgi:hypothetical protein
MARRRGRPHDRGQHRVSQSRSSQCPPDLIAELTQAASDLLIAYGCDSAQGDLLGSPGGFVGLTAPQPDSRHAGAVASPYV